MGGGGDAEAPACTDCGLGLGDRRLWCSWMGDAAIPPSAAAAAAAATFRDDRTRLRSLASVPAARRPPVAARLTLNSGGDGGGRAPGGGTSGRAMRSITSSTISSNTPAQHTARTREDARCDGGQRLTHGHQPLTPQRPAATARTGGVYQAGHRRPRHCLLVLAITTPAGVHLPRRLSVPHTNAPRRLPLGRRNAVAAGRCTGGSRCFALASYEAIGVRDVQLRRHGALQPRQQPLDAGPERLRLCTQRRVLAVQPAVRASENNNTIAQGRRSGWSGSG